MKTITIKLHEREDKELEGYIKKRNYPSKSEFIRNLIMERLERNRKEKMGWLAIAEKSMEKIWRNEKDDKTWGRYL